MADVFKEFADLFGKYGRQWTDEYRKEKGMGWSELPVKPKTALEYNKVFVDFARKGYRVYAELRGGIYFIYVKKPAESGMYRLEPVDGIKIREILMKYKAGLIDTMVAYEYIKDVVEKRR